MKAELRSILPNDTLDWNAFVASPRQQPSDGFGWFTLDIGPEGHQGTNMFQVLISTPSAASQARSPGERQFRGFIVDLFEPEIIRSTLQSYVSSVSGQDWTEIVEQLRKRMEWEYEGMHPA